MGINIGHVEKQQPDKIWSKWIKISRVEKQPEKKLKQVLSGVHQNCHF